MGWDAQSILLLMILDDILYACLSSLVVSPVLCILLDIGEFRGGLVPWV